MRHTSIRGARIRVVALNYYYATLYMMSASNVRDVFNAKDVEGFCNFAEYVLKCGKHGKIFRSAVIFASWSRRFWVYMDDVEEGAGEMEGLEVERTPLFYSHEHCNCLQELRLERLRHENKMEQAIHFCLKRLLLNSVDARVCYNVPGNIESTHPG